MRDTDEHTDDQYHDHMRRIDDIKRTFQHGEIGSQTKRRYITDENMLYYGDEKIRGETGEPLARMPRARDEVAALLADATGAPVEAVTIALQRRRELNRAAADADTVAEARELVADAERSFRQIMAAALPGRHA